jgi:hypothetical protein
VHPQANEVSIKDLGKPLKNPYLCVWTLGALEEQNGDIILATDPLPGKKGKKNPYHCRVQDITPHQMVTAEHVMRSRVGKSRRQSRR